VEPGIFSIFPLKAPLGRENNEEDQELAGKFPQQPEPGIQFVKPGITVEPPEFSQDARDPLNSVDVNDVCS
jgi:hypothetical protein